MSAVNYDHGLLTDAIYWPGASAAICAALNAGDPNEAGRLLKHYADLSHAEETALDAAAKESRPALLVPVIEMHQAQPWADGQAAKAVEAHPIFANALRAFGGGL